MCSPEAFQTFDRIREACFLQTRSPQCWIFNGQKYFFEENPEENKDESIDGEINKQEKQFAEKVGEFRIEKTGEISQGEFGFKALIADSPSQIVNIAVEKEESIEVVNTKKEKTAMEKHIEQIDSDTKRIEQATEMVKKMLPEIAEIEMPVTEEPLLRIMDASQIGMVESENDLIQAAMMVKPLWSIPADEITREQRHKKLNFEGHQRMKAIYPLKMLLEALKFAEKNKATHLEIELGSNKPGSFSFITKNSRDEDKKTTFILAPRIDID